MLQSINMYSYTRRFRIYKKHICVSIIFTIVLIFFLLQKQALIDDVDRSFRIDKIEELIQVESNGLACKQPVLPVFPPDLMQFIEDVPKIDCSSSGEDWVKCIGYECWIQESIKNKYGNVLCSFTDVLRIDDFKLKDGKTTNSNSYYKLEKSDVVKVSCSASGKTWSSTLTGIRMNEEIFSSATWDNLPANAMKMNILMFGFDSVSRNSFIRKLPKSYEYLTKTLEGIVLEGYNIVGDGTPQALIPILTGKTELELPDTRKRYRNTKFVNSYPFIWNDYKDAGYVTAFLEDVPELSIFTYRLNGFKETPVDHYMRTYYLAAFPERSKWPKLCAGEIPRHKMMLNAITDFFNVYKEKPKFLFGFHGEISHDDYNLVGVADDDLLESLVNLKQSGALNNTILIVMSDHGHRFAGIRNTIQGKQEERLPFFSFTFPKWFKKTYKNFYQNFKKNVNKLTTPFDIHETLKDVLSIEDTTQPADISQRSVSLFLEIPPERSCKHAYIEPHWCACLDWKVIPLSDPIVERLANKLIFKLNNYTSSYKHLCERLVVSEVNWVTKMSPNDRFLKFNKNADKDGFVGEFSAKMELKENTYQIKATLTPGNSIFEASVTHYLDDDRLELRLEDVSRINVYGRQARCIENEYPHLRKYCYCKDDL